VVSIYKPYTLIELAMARSLLAAHNIPYFVHNGGYASLYPGMQIHLLNVPTVMVPPSAAEFAKELLRAYLPDVADHLRPKIERSPWHILRMLVEAICCVWFVPRIGTNAKKVQTEP
jgi:Putative prokaryotic signal transducing protein